MSSLVDHKVFKIVETDASDIGYGGILKQRSNNQKLLVRFTSGTWNHAQLNYSTIKKEILSIVLLRVDCKSAKLILQKNVKNIASKHIFAR